ncbi:MAG: hypothetical protein IJA67_11610 [Oscillospiraceae bacterium]|nr:hypothetical protein [Oscillospiraceae bacterium]
MLLLITTGLRRGECIGLQWGDIDEKQSVLKVQRNVTQGSLQSAGAFAVFQRGSALGFAKDL